MTDMIEQHLEKPRKQDSSGLLAQFEAACAVVLDEEMIPVRFAVTATLESRYEYEVSLLDRSLLLQRPTPRSIFDFKRRLVERTEQFNTVLVVPTGIGAEIGGHAGDAGPVANMLGEVSDTLVVHPNVVNASDLNEMPANALYVEGSVLTRLLMGTLGLQPVRSNRVLVVMDEHKDELFVNAAANAVSGARSAYGLSCPEVVCLTPPVKLRTRYSPSGRAAGLIEGLEGLCRVFDDRAGQYDAVAIASVIEVPDLYYHQSYFDAGGQMVNPWGGVEAMLTHSLSSIYNVTTAHSPMFESRDIANMDVGIVDPRMAAEAVSFTFLQCALKGLHCTPRIVTGQEAMAQPGIFTAADVSCLVIPDGCLGLPTLAALEQDISVIAVSENSNLMRNDLTGLPWKVGQFYQVHNYWEAAGLIASMRAGIDPVAVRRPLAATRVSHVEIRIPDHSNREGLPSSQKVESRE